MTALGDIRQLQFGEKRAMEAIGRLVRINGWLFFSQVCPRLNPLRRAQATTIKAGVGSEMMYAGQNLD